MPELETPGTGAPEEERVFQSTVELLDLYRAWGRRFTPIMGTVILATFFLMWLLSGARQEMVLHFAVSTLFVWGILAWVVLRQKIKLLNHEPQTVRVTRETITLDGPLGNFYIDLRDIKKLRAVPNTQNPQKIYVSTASQTQVIHSVANLSILYKHLEQAVYLRKHVLASDLEKEQLRRVRVVKRNILIIQVILALAFFGMGLMTFRRWPKDLKEAMVKVIGYTWAFLTASFGFLANYFEERIREQRGAIVSVSLALIFVILGLALLGKLSWALVALFT